MIVKRYSYIVLLIGCACLFSCGKKLDIAPENTLVDKDVFKTEAGTEQALAEVYYNLLTAATDNYSYTMGDFTTPLLNHSTSFNTWDQGEAVPADDIVKNIWANYFKTINKANNVIVKIQEFAQYNETKQAQQIAECKFIRAFCYLNLLQLFGDGALTGKSDGMGVPLPLTPFQGYNTAEIIPRSSNGEVYAQIINDLTESVPSLPVQYPNELSTRSRATKGGAYALLARANLYKGDYAAAAAAAKNILDLPSTVYSLTTNLRSLFPDNSAGLEQTPSPEYILALPVSFIKSSSTAVNNNISYGYYYKYSFWINTDFLNEFDPGDLRKSQLIWKGDSIYNAARLNDYTTFKVNNTNGRDNVSLIRLAEVILTRAEALARVTTGLSDEAITLLNNVRSRALPSATPYSISSFSTKDDLINTILKQRKFELAFEGFYRYDLIRTGRPLKTPDIPENRKVLPVPQIEIDISNGIIKQNPGYQ